MRQHRWSGWPGAICLDCGAEDQVEYCVGTCPNAFTDCRCGGKAEPRDSCPFCFGQGIIPATCPVHQNGPCPGPPEGN